MKRPPVIRIVIQCTILLALGNRLCLSQETKNASGGPILPEQAAYDVKHYDLTLRIDPENKSIDGAVVVDAKIVQPVGWFVLDLDPRFKVSAVQSLGMLKTDAPTAMAFEWRERQLWCKFPLMKQPGDSVKIRVAYSGKPKVAPRPPWDDGFVWSKTPSGKPWIGVSCEADGADVWWPCKDHPSDRADSMSLHFTVPESLVCAASGKLGGVVSNSDHTRTWNWNVSTPINNYAMSINIAPYKSVETTYKSATGEPTNVIFYAIPEHYEKAKELTTKFLHMISFLEEKCGPYPFRADKIGVAETPYLGMEHQTITAYGDRFRDNEFGFDWLLYHEFAHEWFANLVVNADWKDMWIHEGFASYLEALYAERLKGEAGYSGYMARFRSGLVNSRSVAPIETKNSNEIYVDNDIYFKGACILGSLRYLLGDQKFFIALRRMAYPSAAMEAVKDGRQCRYATTDDFLHTAEAAGGRPLGWFFDVYLRQPKLPKLVAETLDGKLRLHWETPGNLPFPMPVDVKLGDKTQRVNVTNEGVTITVPEGVTPIVDPMKRVLRESAN